jgi:quinohemoprotein ethanol dehydrogenase
VLVGWGGSSGIGSDVMRIGWRWGAPRRLLSFDLGGTATLPPAAPRDLRVHALDDPKLAIKPADVQAGRALYMNCVLCHGRDLNGAGAPAPDLRESQIALDRASLWSVLHDGTLIQLGMPRFETMSRTQADQLYAYIRAGARDALKAGQ